MGYGEEVGGSSSQSFVFKNLRRGYLLSPIKGSLKDGYNYECKQIFEEFPNKKTEMKPRHL